MTSRVSFAICTLNRPKILIQTIEDVWRLKTQPDELIVIDQSDELSEEMQDFYERNKHRIRVVRMKEKGQGLARNAVLREAAYGIVLFTDDDVRISSDLVYHHKKHYQDPKVAAVQGRVDDANGDPPACGGRVNWYGKVTVDRSVDSVHSIEGLIGCNMSLRLDVARLLSGFWQLQGNTVQMHEETDLALRMIRAGYQVICEPEAALLHLAYKSGGTRSLANRITWYESYFSSEYSYFFRNFPKWMLPFYMASLVRPILACSIYYGRFRPTAIMTPWKALVRAWQ